MGRRRRPSGEPPPLPREFRASTRWYVAAVALTVVLSVAMATRPVFTAVTDVDEVVLRAVARVRFDVATTVLRWVDDVGTSWVVRAIAWATIAVLVVYRRFGYLAAYLAVLLAGSLGALVDANAIGRPRPTSVAILSGWTGVAFPSRPVVAVGLVLVGVVYTLVPSGPWRGRAKLAAAAVLLLFAATRMYLAVDHPSDVLAGLVLGWALPVAALRLLTPEDAFPVGYRRGRRAHLDIGGRRGDAIVRALDQQLGLAVLRVDSFGGAGSAGSTPLRLTLAHDGSGPDALFAKLYAVSHLRADRWYKLTRTILYGRLEDEKPFSTVRRLAEYEDHMLRLFRDAGLPTPAPYGFVEITPEREYVIVMELFDGANEIGSVDIDVGVIDDALRTVRRLWNAGIAHRDIKPSNVLTADHRALLIDVAFATVRPTPWRQAVDLANTMLTLALSNSPELVYERALLQFDEDEIAEAFAATRSVTVPTQLRARLRADGRDVLAAFRRLAPARPSVRIQVWTLRRAGLTLMVLAALGLGVSGAVAYARAAGLAGSVRTAAPHCDDSRRLAVVAQSVSSASYVPCIDALRPGWSSRDFDARSGHTRFQMVSDRDARHPVTVRLEKSCAIGAATATTPRADGARTYVLLRSITPRYSGTLLDVFPGGCVTYRFDFARGPHISLMDDLGHQVQLVARTELALALRTHYRIDLAR